MRQERNKKNNWNIPLNIDKIITKSLMDKNQLKVIINKN